MPHGAVLVLDHIDRLQIREPHNAKRHWNAMSFRVAGFPCALALTAAN